MAKDIKVDFIGIGSVKSGSTWIAECLKEHPEVGFSSKNLRKELCFFNTPECRGLLKRCPSMYSKGLSWYLDQFPKDSRVKGEFSVAYLPDPKAPWRIKRLFPNVKILVVLRDPVEMLYSFYTSRRPSLVEAVPPTFAEFMNEGESWKLGLFYKHLRRYFEIFPKENIFVTLLEEIKKDSEGVAEKLYEFLEVDSNFKPSTVGKKINPTHRPKSERFRQISRSLLRGLGPLGIDKRIVGSNFIHRVYTTLNTSRDRFPPLDKKTKKEFSKLYLKDIEKLEDLIGRDLGHWR